MPIPGIEHRLHRAFAGPRLPRHVAIVDRDGRIRHYVADELPMQVPATAEIQNRWQENWDGGPPLLERVAIVDETLRGVTTVMRIAEEQARVVSGCLQAWGLAPLTTCTWIIGACDRATTLAARRAEDALRAFQACMEDLAPVDARDEWWDERARAGDVFPAALEDPYGAFGPGGPPTIPEAWRGRRYADLPNPYPALLAARACGAPILALAGDEAVFELPR